MKATISRKSPRYANWMEVYGTDTVEVLDPQPVIHEGPDDARAFFRLDVDSLTSEQRRRLVRFLSQRWKLGPGEVDHLIDDPQHGVPIRADDVAIQGTLWTPPAPRRNDKLRNGPDVFDMRLLT
ncbi:MAG: hypothetical protein ACRD9L_15180 [Bryobacteraceae bacterium]